MELRVTVDEVVAFLATKGLESSVSPIEYGQQVKAASGEVVNVYDTGKLVVQGKATPLKAELQEYCARGVSNTAVPIAGTIPSTPATPKTNIFVVYGHDTASRDGLELLLRRMGLNPIVLANLPASGDTIIEKLEHYLDETGDVGFACVLLTPDDEGHSVAAPEEKKYRARQNVILELGMVLAKLNRKRVAILYKESVERPSDIDGLIYLAFKEHVSEAKALLFRELQSAGYSPDPSAL